MLKNSQETLHFGSTNSALTGLFTVNPSLTFTDLYEDDCQWNFSFNIFFSV